MLRIPFLYNNLLKNQVHPLFSSTRSGGLGNIFAACLVYALVRHTDLHTEALILTLTIAVLSIIRILISDRYLKHQGEPGLSLYLGSHFSLTLFIGICWGLYALMQNTQQDEAIRNIVFLINFALIAGSIATLSAWMPTYIAYMLPQSLAIFYASLTQGTTYDYYMAFGFFIFAIIMISTSFGINRSLRKELQLKLKNKSLINDLNEEISERRLMQELLEESKKSLEIKVVERTRELVVINADLEREIKEKQQAEINLQYIAYHDELTGLPNKTLLVDRIDRAIDSANRYKHQIGILFLDLDRFKNINDSLGHTIGDKLIQEVSRRLLKTIRKEDTISRNSGDEFVIVIQRMENSDEAILVAKKIIRNLTSYFDIDSHKIHIGASIGISVYPTDANTPLELLRNADTAMYRAKKAGGNKLQFYDESMSNSLRERLQIENELHTALVRDEFYIVYQPQVDCSTGLTTGFEALLRWKNDSLGPISPELFVPLLEETGLIYNTGEWIISQVIEFIRTGQAGDLKVSINLSTLQCKDISLIIHLQDMIKKAEINPKQLEFEITESLLINDFDKTEIFLNELHVIGCTIALDDFGTGYTSMSYLTRLPIDVIKVDKSFIRNIDTNDTLVNIVKAIIKMSNSLGIKNVFEGVETKEELEVIKHLDGKVIQGYYFSEPLLVEEIDHWMSINNQKVSLVSSMHH